MRTILIGAVESTAVTLARMRDLGQPPCAVVTLSAEYSGRHSDFVDLKAPAMEAGSDLVEVNRANDPWVIDRLRNYDADYLFVIGWSQICSAELRAIGRRGSIGFHPAPLPKMRGRAVIPWTILLGENETGATLFWMDDGIDSGDILAQRKYPVAEDETARTLMDKHLAALSEMLSDILPALAEGRTYAKPQDANAATYCARRTPADGLITWAQPSRDVARLIRAVGRPYPGAFTFHGDRKVIIWRATPLADPAYIALPGQIYRYEADCPVVRCAGSDSLRLDEYEICDAADNPSADRFTGQQNLGLRLNGALLS